MCLPTQFLKRFQYQSTILGLVLSIISILLGIVQCFMQTTKFWDMTNYRWPLVSSILLVVNGIFLLIFSCLGFLGIKNNNHGRFACYYYGVIVSFIGFTILGVITLVHVNNIANSLINYYESGCNNANLNNQQWLNELQITVNKAESIFGQSQSCPVYLDYNNQQTMINFQSYFENYTLIKNNGNTNVQDCIPYQQNWNKIMESAENDYQCSGFCQQINYYMFSNVNNGYSKQSCFNSIYNRVKDFGFINGIFSCCFAGLLLLNILAQLCFCCHPQKQDQDVNPYLQMQVQSMQ